MRGAEAVSQCGGTEAAGRGAAGGSQKCGGTEAAGRGAAGGSQKRGGTEAAGRGAAGGSQKRGGTEAAGRGAAGGSQKRGGTEAAGRGAAGGSQKRGGTEAASQYGGALSYLIWDYDGTLHETMRVYKPAIAAVVRWLSLERRFVVEMPSDGRIRSWLGMSTAAMWKDFAPQLPDAVKKEAGAFVGQRMKEEILAGRGEWYPGAEKMLDRLKAAGYSMSVLSNCDAAYAKLNWEKWGMNRWFDAFYDCASYGFLSKADVLEQIAEELDLDKGAVVIGDRGSDLEMARRIGARFIWCSYGYGTKEEMEGCGFEGGSASAAGEIASAAGEIVSAAGEIVSAAGEIVSAAGEIAEKLLK